MPDYTYQTPLTDFAQATAGPVNTLAQFWARRPMLEAQARQLQASTAHSLAGIPLLGAGADRAIAQTSLYNAKTGKSEEERKRLEWNGRMLDIVMKNTSAAVEEHKQGIIGPATKAALAAGHAMNVGSHAGNQAKDLAGSFATAESAGDPLATAAAAGLPGLAMGRTVAQDRSTMIPVPQGGAVLQGLSPTASMPPAINAPTINGGSAAPQGQLRVLGTNPVSPKSFNERNTDLGVANLTQRALDDFDRMTARMAKAYELDPRGLAALVQKRDVERAQVKANMDLTLGHLLSGYTNTPPTITPLGTNTIPRFRWTPQGLVPLQ